MRFRRLTAGLAAAVVLLGLAAAVTSQADVTVTAATGPDRPASAAPVDRTPFAGRLLVYSDKPFTRAQVAAVRSATQARVAAVSLYQDDVASGDPLYPDIPVQTMVIDPEEYSAAVGDRGLAAGLSRGAVLAATEARLRRLSVGDAVRFSDGRRVPVTAVVDDHVLGGNELSLPRRASRAPDSDADYLLVAGHGDQQATDRAVRRALPSRRLRVLTRTANGFFSSADRVLTQLQVKARFGEFAMRRTGRTTFEPDPRWVERHLVTRRVPQLGVVTCNRAMLPALTAAMVEVTERGLGKTVDTADFRYQGGCWNPNIIPGADGTVSRHSWGIAVDINVDTNAFGYPPRQDGRLLSIMRKHGFAWGGEWLTPDGMHFEAVATR